MISLRKMEIDDIDFLRRWDEDADVAAALGGPAMAWYDWSTELARNVAWREFFIAEEIDRPVGFVQLIDAANEETHYWGNVDADTWAIDVWIGSPFDRGRGVGTAIMSQAIDRAFAHHGAQCLLIDPMVSNTRAINFYQAMGFEQVGVRDFDGDRCLVMRRNQTN